MEKASSNDTDIKAFMFYNNEENIGFVMVFCPEKCEQTQYRAVLKGLQPDLSYTLEDMDSPKG